ncbi:hypothetical protein BC936DRAFT_146037 [Jimgerdemannia flammicorona]|uniref:Uncharacterized protein n=1 Tax=Jimgerdemannia flammicorona TaxID=994334 RepID=A0A433D8J2_9FUNG|nr:hypothetical protein BC936DRAFT_146037 [Jimgerdemannia flammicorona]
MCLSTPQEHVFLRREGASKTDPDLIEREKVKRLSKEYRVIQTSETHNVWCTQIHCLRPLQQKLRGEGLTVRFESNI